jgi:hypothetical protein
MHLARNERLNGPTLLVHPEGLRRGAKPNALKVRQQCVNRRRP